MAADRRPSHTRHHHPTASSTSSFASLVSPSPSPSPSSRQKTNNCSTSSGTTTTIFFILSLFLFFNFPTSITAYPSRDERLRKHPEVFDFPFVGRGDPDHSFLHPYVPSPGGDPINGWFQLGTTSISRSQPTGRDIVRLTGAAQGNQGILYNAIRTETNNINGYIDIQVDSSKESHEPADGMGFFFTQDRPEVGSAMGLTETYKGLGIIIDTFSNSRSKHTPYMYAYISDGMKKWNPDTDGSDTEITRGCQLEMNTQVRIYIQYVDQELHVGVAMNPRTPHRWHTCFKASNVQLPFNKGGFLTFAGETGHFFALHEVHGAAFVDESEHSGHAEYQQQVYTAGRSGEYQHEQHEQKQQQQQEPQHRPEREKKVMEDRSDPATRVHQGGSGQESLSGSLDLQVYEVFNSMSQALKGLHDKDSEEAKLRFDGVRDITGHLLQELGKQKTEMSSIVKLMQHLKESTNELKQDSERFRTQIKNLHSSISLLKDIHSKQLSSHDEIHEKLIDHHLSLTDSDSKNGGNGIIILFFVVQLIIVSMFIIIQRMSSASKKIGRMV